MFIASSGVAVHGLAAVLPAAGAGVLVLQLVQLSWHWELPVQQATALALPTTAWGFGVEN